jgi:Winged helix-turn helix
VARHPRGRRWRWPGLAGSLASLSWPAVRTAIDLYEAGGPAAIKPKERGKKNGEGRKLSAEQEAHIRKLIVGKRPEQLKMEFALWTRAAVGQLIEHEFKIELSTSRSKPCADLDVYLSKSTSYRSTFRLHALLKRFC